MDIKVKSEVTRRLQDSGLGKEASAFKEEQRLRLRGEGVRKEEANTRAWELMIEKYPEPDYGVVVDFYELVREPPSLLLQSGKPATMEVLSKVVF